MGDNYQVSVREVLAVVRQLGGLLTALDAATGGVSGVTNPVGSFGALGQSAATGGTGAQQQLTLACTALHTALHLLTERVEKSAAGYAAADTSVAAAYTRTASTIPTRWRS